MSLLVVQVMRKRQRGSRPTFSTFAQFALAQTRSLPLGVEGLACRAKFETGFELQAEVSLGETY